MPKLYFAIKVPVPKNDPFYMVEAKDFIYLIACGYTDLAKTIRHLTAQGYKTGKPRKYSKYFRCGYNDLELKSPFFGTLMFHIFRRSHPVEVDRLFEHENKRGEKLFIKIITEEKFNNYN